LYGKTSVVRGLRTTGLLVIVCDVRDSQGVICGK
jgi:hypothetical protein